MLFKVDREAFVKRVRNHPELLTESIEKYNTSAMYYSNFDGELVASAVYVASTFGGVVKVTYRITNGINL